MNLVADESVDRQIVDALRGAGHQVWYVAEMTPGIADEAVLGLASREDALLITADKDFGELVFRQGRSAAGVTSFDWQVFPRLTRHRLLPPQSENM